MQNLIAVVPRIVNDKFNTISINVLIKNNWAEILDQDLLSFVRFNRAMVSATRLGNSRELEIENPNLTNPDAMYQNYEFSLKVVIDVISSAVIFARMWIHRISESIRLLIGIDSINIVFHQVLSLKEVA